MLRIRRSFLSAIALGVFVAGCGGGDGTTEETPGTVDAGGAAGKDAGKDSGKDSGKAGSDAGMDASGGSGGSGGATDGGAGGSGGKTDGGAGGATDGGAGTGGSGGKTDGGAGGATDGGAGTGGSAGKPDGGAGTGGSAGKPDGGADSGADGSADAGVCTPKATKACYSGPKGTENVGMCKAGLQTCLDNGSGYGPCTGEVLPAAQESCATAGDDNCNGQTNENCLCTPKQKVACYEGPKGTENVGVCKGGTKTCADDGKGFGACTGQVVPKTEDCATALDENCDGKVNETTSGCLCEPNKTAPCYEGATGTENVGICHSGTKTCAADGKSYGTCKDQQVPKAEDCTTKDDDNCDGTANETSAGCLCDPGSTSSCYEGPTGTLGVGICQGGTKTCGNDGKGYGACVGQVVPSAENCATNQDENCDGAVNEAGSGCVCTPTSTAACYEGAPATLNVGICVGGTKTCNADGKGYGNCAGQILPETETCATPEDEDCDGQANESGAACVCVPGATAPCYEGPTGTQNVGICKGGTKTCLSTGTGYGSCEGQVLPSTESCLTAEDDDCSGANLVCTDSSQDCSMKTGKCEEACAASELGYSYVGCEYYPTVTANMVSSSFAFAVAVSNTSAKPAQVEITRGGAAISSATVAANSVSIINLPWISSLKGPDSNAVVPMPSSVLAVDGAYKVLSDRPVTVYQYSPLNYTAGGSYSYTNDASLLLPANAWTGTYRVMARHHFYSASGFLAVTAKDDNTQVTLTAGPQSGQVKSGVTGIGTNGSGSVTLNAGDVMEIVTNGANNASDPNDVTGTLISATKPVQVIGGHQCIYIPDNTAACDHLEESMFPVETLAREYIVTSPLIALNTAKDSMVRIMATEPNTTLSYDPAQAGAPATIAQAGQWVEFQSGNSFKITSNNKIMVAQYMLGQDAGGSRGDPAMSLAVATAQYRMSYLFHAPTNYESNFVNITAPAGATVLLDGTAVSGFVAIGSSGFSIAKVPLTNTGNGNHTVSSTQRVGITVYGYGQYTSYWYPGGLDLNIIL